MPLPPNWQKSIPQRAHANSTATSSAPKSIGILFASNLVHGSKFPLQKKASSRTGATWMAVESVSTSAVPTASALPSLMARSSFSTEVIWNPYFETNPDYHLAEINDSLERAAAHLPRVDAIGGSVAGIYLNNEVRTASLFRGITPELFESRVRNIFFELKERWGNVPFEVINDGEVTALAGSMAMNENSVLGIAMGTSEAVGYISPEGAITSNLNELAFAPIDYRAKAPADEWSGDLGCGVQYLSQQAVSRLIPASGLPISPDLPFAEQLVKVQEAMTDDDERAAQIYRSIGVYLGYAIAHYSSFYHIQKILLLGRVTSGKGGSLIQSKAEEVLATEFPSLAQQIQIVTPSEQEKRHGQAVAAASLPNIG